MTDLCAGLTALEKRVMCCAVGTCGVHCAVLAPQYSWVRFQCSADASCFQSHNSTGGQIFFFLQFYQEVAEA